MSALLGDTEMTPLQPMPQKLLLVSDLMSNAMLLSTNSLPNTSFLLYNPQVDTFDSLLQKIDNLGILSFDEIGIIFNGSKKTDPTNPIVPELPLSSISTSTPQTFKLLDAQVTASVLNNVNAIDPLLVSWGEIRDFLNLLKTKYSVNTFDVFTYNNSDWNYILNVLGSQIGNNNNNNNNSIIPLATSTSQMRLASDVNGIVLPDICFKYFTENSMTFMIHFDINMIIFAPLPLPPPPPPPPIPFPPSLSSLPPLPGMSNPLPNLVPNQQNCTNLILIDSRVKAYDRIIASANIDTAYIVFDYAVDTIDTLKTKIAALSIEVIVAVGIVQDNYISPNYQWLASMQPAMLEDIETTDASLNSWTDVKDFCSFLKNEKGTQFYDLLACNTYSNPDWVYALNQLETACGMNFRASSDVTGWGGNWILESDSVDLTTIYFTEMIYQWEYSLDNIAGNRTIDQAYITSVAVWPVTIAAGVTITFTSDINLSSNTQYFVIDGHNVTIDGGGFKVTLLSTMTGWGGLFGNSSKNNSTIKNLGITTTGTNVLSNCVGYLCRQSFGTGSSSAAPCTNNNVINCYNSGTINGSGNGGIVGYNSANNYGNVTATNCYNTGPISGGQCGGIFGQAVGNNNGNATAINCYNISTGTITGSQCGGIFGPNAGGYNGNATAINCYNNGAINATDNGGIFGYFPGERNGNVTATNCYNTGPISGNNSGGIFSSYAGSNVGNATATNCYNTGAISSPNGGGIFGEYAGISGNAAATNCYNTGQITGPISNANSGGIFGNQAGREGLATAINCYNSSGASINGGNSGGIFGYQAGTLNGNAIARNCYNTDPINGTSSGGIFGQYACSNSGNAIAINCYSTGTITTAGNGGIFGQYAGSGGGTATATNCVVFSSSNAAIAGTSSTFTSPSSGIATSWSDSTADLYLIGKSDGSIWFDVTSNTSQNYLLSNNYMAALAAGYTYTNTTAPPPPTNVSVVAVGYNSALITFTQTSPNTYTYAPPTGYSYNYATILGTQADISFNNVSTFYTNSIMITGLTPNTNYTYLKLKFYNAYGGFSSNYSTPIISVTTSAGSLGNTISSSRPFSAGDVLNYTWPITINTSGVTITFTSDITLISNKQYFIIGVDNITIDGAGYKVTLDSTMTGWGGLFDNSRKNNSTIKNLGIVTTGNAVLANNAGYLCRQNFGSGNSSSAPSTNNNVINCYSTGTINGTGSGGIFGSSAGNYYGNVTATNCYNTGPISGSQSGGIFGTQAGTSYGNPTATNCYNTGPISGTNSGGIFGYYAGSSNGNATAINCYNTATISGTSSGGIFGNIAGGYNGNVIATNCYNSSTGTISGSSSGGIFGNAAGNSGTAKATNCYNTATINGSGSGGIFGQQAGASSGTAIAINSYSTGTITAGNGGIFGQQASSGGGTATATNCYVVSSANAAIAGTSSTITPTSSGTATSWTDSVADLYLTGKSDGSIWFDVTSNTTQSYLLSNNYTAALAAAQTAGTYTAANITSVSNAPGTPTNVSVVPGYNSFVITFTQPSSNLYYAAPPTGYSYTINGATDISVNNVSTFYTNSIIITGLNPNTIYSNLKLKFYNAYGSSSYFISSSFTTTSYPVSYGSTISVSRTFLAGDVSKYTWPITIMNLGTIVTFSSDITLTSSTQYFIIGSDNVTIDGAGYKVILPPTMINWNGLVQNGVSGTAGKNNITIQNLGIVTTGTGVLTSNTGYLCWTYFGYGNGSTAPCINNNVINCYNSGTINGTGNGGIFGEYAGNYYGNVTATNCYNTGPISGTQCGGIFGQYAGYNYGNATATNCYNTGPINGANSGGIFGFYSGSTSGKAIATNCYNTGTISGGQCGGIFAYGTGANSGNAIATNCYNSSTGTISGSSSGGIFGYYAGVNSGNVKATNCYNTGPISGGLSGGIFGEYAGRNSGTALAINCYSTGTITAGNGGIFGQNAGSGGTATATNCYVVSSSNLAIAGTGSTFTSPSSGTATSWSDTNGFLRGVTDGSIWFDVVAADNKSYLLSNNYTAALAAGYTYTNITAPSPPTIISATATGYNSVDISFTQTSPNTYAPPTGYSYSFTSGGTYIAVNNVPTFYLNSITITGINGNTSLYLKFLNGYGTPTSTPVINISAPTGSYTNTISSSCNFSSGDITKYTWPITIMNLGTIVTFTSDITWNLATQYFIIGSDNVTIDGAGYKVTLPPAMTGWNGLVRNGVSGTAGKNNITIQNLGIVTTGTGVLADNAGYLCWTYFGAAYSSRPSTNNNVINCYSTGTINGTQCGGIFGSYAGHNYGDVTATNCYNTGPISGSSSGGIFGYFAGSNNGIARAINSYNTGAISGSSSGGIFGSSAGQYGTAIAFNSYSTGTISTANSGGIFGQAAGVQGIVTATNCYVVSSANAAIAGASSTITSTSSGTATSWTDSVADLYLIGKSDGSIWFDVTSITTQSYLLSNNYKAALAAAQTAGTYTAGNITSVSNAPLAPTIVSVVAGYNSAIITFTQASPNTYTYAPPTGYYYNITGGSVPGLNGTDSPLNFGTSLYTNSIMITGLNPNTNYTNLRIKFFNAYGSPSYSTPLSFTTSAGVLGSTISTSCTFSAGDILNYTWPITIMNPYTIVTFSANITLTSPTQYFIIGSDNVTIDGAGYVVTLDSTMRGWTGLVQNGLSGVAGKSGCTIQNIGIVATGTGILANNAGYLCQQNFGSGNSNSSSAPSTNNNVINCYSTGTINGTGSGGIFGSSAGNYYGNVTATNCYNTGTISGSSSGGIFGVQAGSNTGNATATNCYNTGAISGSNNGGIFGPYVGNLGNALAINSYSTGAITSGGGGIFGSNVGAQGIVTATNCYVVSSANAAIAGASSTITSTSSGTATSWTDSVADLYLIGKSDGSIWFDVTSITTQSYLLSNNYKAALAAGYTYTNITAPSAPTNVSVVAGYNSALITFTQTSPNTFTYAPPTGYYYNITGGSVPGLNGTDSPLNFGTSLYTNSIMITGLNPSTNYTNLRIKFFNAYGSPSYSTSSSFTTSGSINGNTISTSRTFSSGDVLNYTWPITIMNSGIVVTFSGNIRLTSPAQYFIIGADNVTIDGAGYVVTLDSKMRDWNGLVQNGLSGTAGKNGCTIQNIGIVTTGTGVLANNASYLCWSYFGAGNSIAAPCINNNVINCYSTGIINSTNSGGIFGAYAGSNYGNATATNCYNTGAISGTNSGGIFASYAGYYLCDVTATNCYNTGAINGIGSGGIFGGYTNNGVRVINSYSTGTINGAGSGGIFGQSAGSSASRATNCYVVSSVNVAIAGSNSPNITILSSGTATSWSDSTADLYLTGKSDGSIWFDVTSNTTQSYLLSNNYKAALAAAQTAGTYTAGNITSVSNAPSPPTNVSVVAGYNSALITFTQTSPNTFTYAPPTGYYYNITGGSVQGLNGTDSPLNFGTFLYTNSIMITGLSPNTNYTNLRLKFFNAYGSPSYSTPSSFTTSVGALGSTISSNRTFSAGDVLNYTWPITIMNPYTIVTFSANITLTSPTQYFIIGSDNVTIDGAGYVVTFVSNMLGWKGLFYNGVMGNAGKNGCTIKNIGIVTTGTGVLANNAGYLCQQYFGSGNMNPLTTCTNNRIISCYNSSPINSTGSGGILGSYNGYYYGNITATNCYNTGPISGVNSGGIFGMFAGSSYGNASAINSYSTGAITTGNGGIFGPFAANGGGTALATNCYVVSSANAAIAGSSSTITSTSSGTTAGSWNSNTANTYLTNYSDGALNVWLRLDSSYTNNISNITSERYFLTYNCTAELINKFNTLILATNAFYNATGYNALCVRPIIRSVSGQTITFTPGTCSKNVITNYEYSTSTDNITWSAWTLFSPAVENAHTATTATIPANITFTYVKILAVDVVDGPPSPTFSILNPSTATQTYFGSLRYLGSLYCSSLVSGTIGSNTGSIMSAISGTLYVICIHAGTGPAILSVITEPVNATSPNNAAYYWYGSVSGLINGYPYFATPFQASSQMNLSINTIGTITIAQTSGLPANIYWTIQYMASTDSLGNGAF